MRIFSILIILCLLLSCQPEGRVYIEHQDLSPQIEWLQKDSRVFEVPIEDNAKPFKMSMSFRFATGYQFQVAKIKVSELSPSGIEIVYNYQLKVIEDNGEYIGDPGLDIWDSEHVVEKSKKFDEVGTYTYKVEHDMPVDPLNFAMEVGIILDEIKP
jgi:gliding motility-associated lipoprotein GldH